MADFRTNVLDARRRLAEGRRELERRHRAGCSGLVLCAGVAELRDRVLCDLFQAALRDLVRGGPSCPASEVALAACGGYGRRDVAPFSDVDLMLLHAPEAAEQVAPLAERLVRDVFDAGLVLGHSVRTPAEACRMAVADPTICTSLIDARLLAGSERLFRQFVEPFRDRVSGRARALITAIERARRQERARYGETVYLLEPNVKKSRGGLRDLQLVRWIGLVRYGAAEPERLHSLGVLSEADLESIARAGDFLLRLRNELHFHAGRASDVLDRAEQLRIADEFGYAPAAGILTVEQFMRDYFRHTGRASYAVHRFVAKALASDRAARLVTAAFGHRVEGGVRVGPAGLVATPQGLEPLRGNLSEIMRLVALANLYDKPIAPSTWEVIRREAARLPDSLPGEARRRFLSLLGHPARLGPLLRDLHDAGILERFIPQYAHARGLLQFNQYHKFTVDEHCIRAVECATELAADTGPVGRVYRRIAPKHLLHLALLIHDLGKGYPDDHRQMGLKIAAETAGRLGLEERETDVLCFLVHKHLLMNHLAFRRDTGDERLVVRFAVQVGTPELLQMLYVLSACDFAAVGPGVWDGWKCEILTDLYHRTMQHLAGDSPATDPEAGLQQRRRAVAAGLGPKADVPWFARQLQSLPNSYLGTTEPEQVAADLQILYRLPPSGATATGHYLPQAETVQFTVATCEEIAPGVFHRLTGALTSHGLQIRSAEINTLPDGLILDRFWVHDPDYAGEPPRERLEEVNRALVQSLRATSRPPTFRRTWQVGGHRRVFSPAAKTQVNADNSTSNRYTIFDIFTHDRAGLLYEIARTLFELGLSVSRARIGTHLDQVVDVFYVTDREGNKVEDEGRLQEIRGRLLEVVEPARTDADRRSGGGASDATQRKRQS